MVRVGEATHTGTGSTPSCSRIISTTCAPVCPPTMTKAFVGRPRTFTARETLVPLPPGMVE
jgi:hypothetical protein